MEVCYDPAQPEQIVGFGPPLPGQESFHDDGVSEIDHDMYIIIWSSGSPRVEMKSEAERNNIKAERLRENARREMVASVKTMLQMINENTATQAAIDHNNARAAALLGDVGDAFARGDSPEEIKSIDIGSGWQR